MKGRIRGLGRAMLATLLISGVGASAASAEAPNFTASQYPATAHGTGGAHVFEATGAEVSCTTATLEGELTSASPVLALTPTYTGCTGFYGITTAITGFGHHGEEETCDYVLRTETGEATPPGATVDLVCDPGAEITIESSPCTIHVPAQTGLSTVTLTNGEPSAGTITADFNLSGIEGEITRNNFLCPSHAGTFTEGTFEGSSEIESKSSQGKQIGLDVAPGQGPSSPNFTASKYPVSAHGESSGHLLEATGAEVSCTAATFQAELAQASSTLTVAPSYTGCKGFFGISSTITGFGHYGEEDTCDLRLHTEAEEEEAPPAATVDLVCEPGAEITIESNPCTIHVPAQTGLSSATLTNHTPVSGKVTVDLNLTGITGEMTRNNFLCPVHSGHFSDGSYTATVALEAEDGEGKAASIDVG